MPGTVPGALGIAAFARFKFIGYSLPSRLWKTRERAIPAQAVAIAATGTVIGFVPGPLATFLDAMLLDELLWPKQYSSCERYIVFGLLFVVRIFIGALVLFLFTSRTPLATWVPYCLICWTGRDSHRRMAAPGQLTFC